MNSESQQLGEQPVGEQRSTKSLMSILKSDPASILDAGLQTMDLKSTDGITVEQVVKDFRREKVLFNDVCFIPQGDDSECNTFVYALANFVERMIRIDPMCISLDHTGKLHSESDPVTHSSMVAAFKFNFGDSSSVSSRSSTVPIVDVNFNDGKGSGSGDCDNVGSEAQLRANNIATMILKNACRTGVGSDSFNKTHEIFAVAGETFLIHKSGSHEGKSDGDAPIKIDVVLVPYNGGSSSDADTDLASLSSRGSVSQPEVRNSLVAVAEIWNTFSLFEQHYLEDMDKDSTPLLEIDTVVVDEMNLRTQERSRKMYFIVYHTETKKYLYPVRMTSDMMKAAPWGDHYGGGDSDTRHNSISSDSGLVSSFNHGDLKTGAGLGDGNFVGGVGGDGVRSRPSMMSRLGSSIIDMFSNNSASAATQSSSAPSTTSTNSTTTSTHS